MGLDMHAGRAVQELVERFAPPCLSQWSGLDVNLTENAIISILQSRCHLVPSPSSPDEYVLPEGARIHTEDELCTMIGPDSLCALESMRSGLVRLDAVGLRRHEDLAKCPLDKLALLAHMLPRRNENREAALAAVTAAVSAPWVLTENFINCTKKDTQKMFLCISGAALPHCAALQAAACSSRCACGCTDPCIARAVRCRRSVLCPACWCALPDGRGWVQVSETRAAVGWRCRL